MHNLGEGLAIGASAAAGQLSLALLLVIGFGAHNATEGFGIVAPLAAAEERRVLGAAGAARAHRRRPHLRGHHRRHAGDRAPARPSPSSAWRPTPILYVVIELLAVARATRLKELVAWGILLGLALGFVTDAIVSAAGA